MFLNLYSYATAAAGLGCLIWFAWWAGRPNKMREDEDAARAFFDAHGHWPDESPPRD